MIRWASQRTPFHFNDDEDHFNATLANILKPRYHGSLGHAQVRRFLAQELKKLGFMVVQNKFREGVNFTNVVGYLNPEAEHVIMLSCHYDTETPRFMKNEIHWGATDGAVPCAILLNVAKTMGEYLRNDLSLRMDIGLAVSTKGKSIKKVLMYFSSWSFLMDINHYLRIRKMRFA